MANAVDENETVPHKGQQIEIFETEAFRDWLNGLRDRKARLLISDRLKRVANGNVGNTRPVGHGVQELKIRYGPGYRIYYVWRGDVLIVLLTGGDKDRQKRDIALAKRLAKEADDGIESDPF